jgi:4'-phosphopantetheinyl transferase
LFHNSASVNGDCSEIMSVLRSNVEHSGCIPPIDLPSQTLDIWYCSLVSASTDADYHCLSATLSPQELEKSRRFKRPQDQRNYVLQRGCLRYILSGYERCSPAALNFVYGDYGKPYLASHTLHFNLSHAQHRLAIAVSTSFAVGIDIEYHKPLSRFEALCQRCLTPTELKKLSELDPLQARHRFFDHWTCKEAYLKGLGVGLTMPMTDVEMHLPTLHLPAIPNPAEMAITHGLRPGWQVYPWQPEANYSAALAIEINAARPQHLTFRLYQTSPNQLIHKDIRLR